VSVRLEPWGKADLALLQKLLADPAMMEHLGGPEGAEKIAERQTRYEQPGSKQFKVVDGASGEGVGWGGYGLLPDEVAGVLECEGEAGAGVCAAAIGVAVGF